MLHLPILKTPQRLAAVLIAALALMGCSEEESYKPASDPAKFSTVCLDGVTYYVARESTPHRGFGYMSVKLDRESKVLLCDAPQAPGRATP